eukprot:gene44098-59710_t
MNDLAEKLNLVPFIEPEDGSKNYRANGFGEVKSYRELNEAIGAYFEKERKAQKLSQATIGELLGTPGHVYQRYEKGNTRFTVARAIHLLELLDLAPIDYVYAAAPHLFGKTQQEAKLRKELIDRIMGLDTETVSDLSRVIAHIHPVNK